MGFSACDCKYVKSTDKYVNCKDKYVNSTDKYVNSTGKYVNSTGKYVNCKDTRKNTFCQVCVTSKMAKGGMKVLKLFANAIVQKF